MASNKCSVKKIYQYINIMWQLHTWKHLCWSLFLILNIAKFFRALTLKNIWKRLLLKMCLWKLFIKRTNFTLKNPDFFNINIRNNWKCLLLFHDWFPIKFEFTHTIFLWHGEKQKQPSEVFCRRRCSQKFCKIPRKTPVPISFLVKLQA